MVMKLNHVPHVVEYKPGDDLRAKLYELVAKVMVYNDNVFTANEIALARDLLDTEWPEHVEDFLRVIAGITVPRDEPIGEAAGALIFPFVNH